MKRVLYLIVFLFLTSLLFCNPKSYEYNLANKDDADDNNKFYYFQLENGGGTWFGVHITSTSINYICGTSTTSYSQAWDNRTTVEYRDPSTYIKHPYSN